MTFTGTIKVVSCHAEGEVGDVIVSGVDEIPEALSGRSLATLLLINDYEIMFCKSLVVASLDM